MKNLIIFLLCMISFNIFSQNELVLNFNTVIPLGAYAKNDLYFGMETIGYAKVGYGADFKFLHQFEDSKFKLGIGINYFQNPYDFKALDIAFINSLGCNEDPIICGFESYFGWDKMYSVSDWRNLDLNLLMGLNVVDFKKIQYNFLVGGGGSLIVSPEFKYNIGFDEELKSNIGFIFNVNSEQSFRYKINEKIYLNASVMYRLSRIKIKFTKNLVNEYTYFDFWQHTLSLKLGIVYILK